MSNSHGLVPGLPNTLPARMLNEFIYCPRLFHLEWVQQRFDTSDDVEEGLYLHRVVDRETGDLPDMTQAVAGRRAQSVYLSSIRLGLTARLDMVDHDTSGAVIPVDYKKGHPDRNGQAWPGDRAQVLVQALLLQDAGYVVHHAEIWYAETRQRVVVVVDGESLTEVENLIAAAWEVAADPVAPDPLIGSPKCPRCSLVGICLPDEIQSLRVPVGERSRLKRLMAPAADSRPVYVVTQGAAVGIRGERLEVRINGELQTSYRLIDISQLCLQGNVTVSPQALRALMARDVPVLWFSYGGWFAGIAQGLPGKNVDLRIAQFQADDDFRLGVARRMISGKIRNSRTLLRRNSRVENDLVANQLKELAVESLGADSPGQLLGLEGVAARLYFGAFLDMISDHSGVDVSGFTDNGRARRPPPDPLNALLSFCYSLLIKDVTVILNAIGFDPYFGVFHRPRFGRPALALDLAEEFRPLIAESTVLQVVNNGEVGPNDFKMRAGACMLKPDGRKSVLRAYERRLDHEITHPQFGYKASYRRILDIQARILAAVMVGELEDYTAMVTR